METRSIGDRVNRYAILPAIPYTRLQPDMRFPQRTTATSSVALLALACVALVATAHPGDEDARALAAGCASCHRASERIPPSLAGQSREAMIAKLRGFRDGTRDGTVMPQLVRGYTPAQLDAVAAWFAGQRPARR